ncbi:MAG: DNA-directed RNA polymerase subunit E [Candidatus Methanomethylophilaceae archaeon]|jgi:DNA-directed RNA polymerase subunit E"|nr:DNA-directed RNA polymerase subunit E [Candidatus Methanomethylophilaceae archaeon]
MSRACKKCSLISDEDSCPRCGEATSKEWQGYVVIVDHQKSDIAKKMGITANGKYALRVR